MAQVGEWGVGRNTYINADFKSEDFAALTLVAGNPPARLPRNRSMTSTHIQRHLDWIQACDTFQSEYFDLRYPYALWIDFMREYKVWCAWHKEKENVPTITEATDDRRDSDR